MSSKQLGTNILEAEVTNISRHGIWLFSGQNEYFLSHKDFPWFKDAPIGKILHVQEPTPGHFYWPDLDIDLSLEIIQNPEKYPLQAR
jgi:Protein of unknown function (DUF2442)